MTEQSAPKGPDLTQGVSIADIPDGGMIGGHVGEDAVLIARRGGEFFAIGATCSHYGGPLAEGLVVGDRISEAGRQLPAKPRPTDGPRERMVIIGGGGAGNAAAEMLRRGGYAGGVTIISDDAAAPYDRPNLSKDYLAGTASCSAAKSWALTSSCSPLAPNQSGCRCQGLICLMCAPCARSPTVAT